MTQKANPSRNRPAEAFKTAGAIAYGGHGGGGFVVNGATPTDISTQDSGITEADLNAFAETSNTSSLDVTIDGGEAFVFGTWLAIDTDTVVSLTASTPGQTVYVGWNKNAANDVIVGLDGAFSSAADDTDERIPLWTFDTDGSGVTNVVDERNIGFSQSIEGGLFLDDDTQAFFGDGEDFSINYNSTSDELEVVDEINDVVKQTFDKNGDVHIPSGALDFRNSNNIQDAGIDAISFDGSQNVGIENGDLVDGASNVIYDQSAGEVPDSAMGSIANSTLTNNSVSIAGNSVSLGGSTTVDYVDLSDTGTTFPIPNTDLSNSSVTVAGNNVALGASTSVSYIDLSDTAASFPIPNSDLNNDTVTVNAGTDVVGGGAVSLGGSITIDHADTSTQGSVTSPTNSAVADLALDGRGHITDINIESRSLDQWNDPVANIDMNGQAIEDNTRTYVSIADNLRLTGELTENASL